MKHLNKENNKTIVLVLLFTLITFLVYPYSAAASAAIIALEIGLFYMTFVNKSQQHHNEMEKNRRNTEALIYLHDLLHPNIQLPRLGGYALSPAKALVYTRLIMDAQPKNIVEFGSGSSTILAAHILKQNGEGKVISFEHDASYAEITRKQLKDLNLEDFADIIHAPLEQQQINDNSWLWYKVDDDWLPDRIDVLFVDGPPKSTQQMARYPAFPRLAERMHQGTYLILDDANRKDEKRIIEQWLSHEKKLEHVSWIVEEDIEVLRIR